MKKTFSLILSLLFIFVLAGCDNTNDSSTPPASSVSENNLGNSDSASQQSTSSNQEAPGDVQGFFDDAVFIGDSVSLKLNLFVDKVRENIGLECLGDAKFLCSGSLSYANSLWDLEDPASVHPSYQGTKYLLPDGVAAVGAKKVFIMLGMNDFSLYGLEETIKNAETVISGIIQKNPDVKIYVQSVTPILEKAQGESFNNENVVKLNTALEKMCGDKGYTYLDVASVLKDDKGNLPSKYCSDPDSQGIHFTDEACEIWIEYLENNAQ